MVWEFWIAYFLTLTIEIPILFLILHQMHKQYGFWLILRNAIAASSITLPFVWFVFPIVGSWFSFGWVVYTSVAEIFAFGIEAIFYRFFFPKMNWKHAIVASFICNLLSFGIGLVAEHVI